jgi:hypothetical protein
VTIAIVVVCIAMLVTGVALTARWFGTPLLSPPEPQNGTAGRSALRVLWWFGLAAAAGGATGLLVVGAGGRLAMRLLAVTAGGDVQGAVTEADEIIGDITLDGTIGFMLFVGIGGGVATGLLYIALQRFLPAGRFLGLWFGTLLLVWFATRIEPLRTNNEDFDLVGPSWLALTVFTVLALVQGMAVTAFASRWSQTQPMLGLSWRSFRYLPLVPILLIFVVDAIIIVCIIIAILVEKFGRGIAQSTKVTVAGRVLVLLFVLVALPGFVGSVVDIAQRGQ